MRSSRWPTILMLVIVVAGAPSTTFAQVIACAQPNDQCVTGGGRAGLRVPLPNLGSVTFNPNGTFAVTMPGFHFEASGDAHSGFDATPRPPTGSPVISIDSSLAAFADEMVANARHCLTLNGIVCEPGTPPSGALNFVSTRVDLRGWLRKPPRTRGTTCCYQPWCSGRTHRTLVWSI
jgi:hypothetical protein